MPHNCACLGLSHRTGIHNSPQHATMMQEWPVQYPSLGRMKVMVAEWLLASRQPLPLMKACSSSHASLQGRQTYCLLLP